MRFFIARGLLLGLMAWPGWGPGVQAQEAGFAVATIRPSVARVPYEHDGKTEVTAGNLRMQDVSVQSCVKWAYGVQDSQVAGPGWMQSDKFDIAAKADTPASEAEMKEMMKTLLAERFKLSFHREQKEMKALIFTVAPGGSKLKPAAAPEGKPYRENSANGTVVKSMPVGEFIDFLSGPLQMPAVDHTGLAGKYDFALYFTPYLPDARNMGPDRPDTTAILKAAMQDELGLKMEGGKAVVEVMVVDHVEKPSAN